MDMHKRFPDGKFYLVREENPTKAICQYCGDGLIVPARLCPACSATENVAIICRQIKQSEGK